MDKSLKQQILDLHNQGRSYNEIKRVLNCSKALVAYYCKKNAGKPNKYLADLIKVYQDYYDQGHSLKQVDEKFGTQRCTLAKYLKLRSKKKPDDEKSRTTVKRQSSYRQRIKQQAVEYKGGKCQICQYSRCIQSLDFHHLDPEQKDFTISGGTRSFETIKKELDKCILVCKNCHTEIHAGLHTDVYPRTDTAQKG